MRVISVAVAMLIVVTTGVAWGKIRSFESGINHINPMALGDGGEDGAIDILLVGNDSRTDAHGNPLSAEELAVLRAGDELLFVAAAGVEDQISAMVQGAPTVSDR